jgi:gluconolactonase
MEWEVLASGYGLVEGPTIDRDGSLLFSDVLGGGVYRRSTDGAIETVVPKRRGVGGIALHANGGIVCSGRDIVHVHDSETRTILHIDGVAGWNDIATDKGGRVYGGALRFPVFDPNAEPVAGEVWRVDPDAGPDLVFDDVVHANGIAFSPDERTMYASDSRAQRIIVFDVDRRVRHDIDAAGYGTPDGMAVDEAGAIWVALVGGGVGRFTPDGRLDRRVDVPSPFVTSVCFDRNDLYVTTGGHENPELKGCVLRTEVDVRGTPVYPARV